MKDPIERQDVIDAIKAIPDGNWSSKRYVTAIKELPSARSASYRQVTGKLDSVSRQAAIDALCSECQGQCIPCESYPCSEVEAINALPSAQSEQTDCDYCHEDSDGYVKPIEKNNHAFVRFGMNGWEINLSAKGWNGSAKIMYCPMCGRRLIDG